jgi:hypothetical protein
MTMMTHFDDDLWHLEYSFSLKYVSDIVFPIEFQKDGREVTGFANHDFLKTLGLHS